MVVNPIHDLFQVLTANQETATFSEEARVKREEKNNSIWINKLPNEILSRIFVTGEEMDQDEDSEQGDNDKEGPDVEFQELVTVSFISRQKIPNDQ